MKKLVILTLIIIIIVLIAIVFINKGHNVVETPENPNANISATPSTSPDEVASISEEPDTDTQPESINEGRPILYFYKYGLVAYYQNGSWHSPTDFKLKDIFNNGTYTIYNHQKEKIRADRIVVNPGFDMNGFRYEGSNENNSQELKQYAIEQNSTGYVFGIPNSLNESLSEKFTESLADVELSSVYFLGEGKNEVDNLLAYNADFDLKFAPKSQIESLPSDVVEFMEKRLVLNDVKKNTPYTIAQYYKVDLNNDGTEDEVFNIVSNDSYKAYGTEYGDNQNTASKLLKENGGFSMIITKINNQLNLIDSCYISKTEVKNSGYDMIGSTENFDIEIVDLNNDNQYEMLYSISGYEYYDFELLFNNNGQYVSFREMNTQNDSTIPGNTYTITVEDEGVDSYSITLNLMDDSTRTFSISDGWGSTCYGQYVISNDSINCVLQSIDVESSAQQSEIESGKLVLEIINENTLRVKEVTPWVPVNKDLKEDVSCLEVGMDLIK